jgi:prefoldin subunit 5
MNPELVREEIEDLTRQIKAAAEALRLLKRRRRNLEQYLNPKLRRERTKEA